MGWGTWVWVLTVPNLVLMSRVQIFFLISIQCSELCFHTGSLLLTWPVRWLHNWHDREQNLGCPEYKDVATGKNKREKNEVERKSSLEWNLYSLNISVKILTGYKGDVWPVSCVTCYWHYCQFLQFLQKSLRLNFKNLLQELLFVALICHDI